MDDSNGALKAPRAAAGINGGVKSPLHGHKGSPRRKAPPSRPGWLARTFSVVARLLTWYSILTILFRCPATLEDCSDASPRICKPYFQLKRAATPHIQPYYDAYAAPYVGSVRPYYNTVDRTIISPSWGYAKQYGAPRLRQAKAFGKAQWEKRVEPQVTKYRDLARAQYDQNLAPHISRASAALGPYYDLAQVHTMQIYQERVLPMYEYVKPRVREGYKAAAAFAGNTIVPGSIWAWNKTYTFLDATVWPQIRAVYVENVEPQLVKIGKRLGRYSSGKKSVPKPLADASTSSSMKTTSSFTKPTASVPVAGAGSDSSFATPSANVAWRGKDGSATESARTRTLVEPIPPPEVDEKLEKKDPARRTAREIVAADLKDWQERYAKAADEGAAEIDERVQEIARKMIRRNARITGKSLLEQLRTAAASELTALRQTIRDIIGSVNSGSTSREEGLEQIVKSVRQAGVVVKNKAQAVRTWREDYDAETQAAITRAAETHFSILENIRDLALQKIGMKWAWMDGVTYKDWAKYHLLKSRFEEWKVDLENLIVTHPSLEAAQIEGANIEDEAMEIAASTAKELVRLKQVANWKLIAGDDSPEFDSALMQQAAEAAEAARTAETSAAEAVLATVEEATEALAEGINTGADLAFGIADEAAADASRAAHEGPEEQVGVGAASSSPADETGESSKDRGAASFAENQSPASEDAPERSESQAAISTSEELSSISEPTSEPSSDAERVSEAEGSGPAEVSAAPEVASSVMFETQSILGNATDAEDESAKLPAEDAPSGDVPTEDSPAGDSGAQDVNAAEEEEILAAQTSCTEASSSDPTQSVKSALFGAAAQSVPSRRPILEDDTPDDVSSAMDSMRRDLESAYSVAMSRANEQYSQALSVVSAQIRGTPEPAHEQLLASVTSAYSKAMASASARLDDALRAASAQLHSTRSPTKGVLPTPPAVAWSRVESIAAERLKQGRAWAEEQYESAKVAAGLATPTPSTPVEHVSKLLDNAKHNYYAGIGLAHARYSEFLAAASSALSSMTATPTPTDVAGSVSSVASVASEGASAAGDHVADAWDAVVTKISVQVYGAPAPTPWYASGYDAAAEYAPSATSAAGVYAAAGSNEVARQYSAVSSIVSELLVGREPSFSESVVSRLSAAYATGVSSASSAASAAQETAAEAAKIVGEKIVSAASDAAEAVKDTVFESKDEL